MLNFLRHIVKVSDVLIWNNDYMARIGSPPFGGNTDGDQLIREYNPIVLLPNIFSFYASDYLAIRARVVFRLMFVYNTSNAAIV
jgi:hypothetical protein